MSAAPGFFTGGVQSVWAAVLSAPTNFLSRHLIHPRIMCSTSTRDVSGVERTDRDLGGTPSYLFHSNWNGANSADVDLTQTSEFGLNSPPASAGLVDFGGYTNAPWAKELEFLLYFHPGLKALGAFYYRLSIVPADASGNPLGGATLAPITTPVNWSKWVIGSDGNWTTTPQLLGPVPANTKPGLIQIPYADDALWLGDQFHQKLDTTTRGTHEIPG
jgi:hypothetical protein